jgi:hypothetical protein
MIDHEILKKELQDPRYAEAIKAGNDSLCAELLNAPSDAKVSRGVISRNDFIGDVASIVLNLMLKAQGGDKQAAFWLDFYDRVVVPKDTFNTESAAMQGFFMRLSKDGFMDDAMIEELTMRAGSRAEEMFGSGTIISRQDVLKSTGRLGP